jgi:hypothetical protein
MSSINKQGLDAIVERLGKTEEIDLSSTLPKKETNMLSGYDLSSPLKTPRIDIDEIQKMQIEESQKKEEINNVSPNNKNPIIVALKESIEGGVKSGIETIVSKIEGKEVEENKENKENKEDKENIVEFKKSIKDVFDNVNIIGKEIKNVALESINNVIYDITSKTNNTNIIVDKKIRECKFDDLKIGCFDLLIFYHKSMTSKIILEAESLRTHMNTCSHVGLALTGLNIPHINMSTPKIWESTVPLRADPLDLETGKHKNGVQIRELKDVVYSYTKSGGKVGLCKLKNNPMAMDAIKAQKQFTVLYNKYKSYKYTHIYNLLGAVCPCFRLQRDLLNIIVKDNVVFCSEFVTEVYEGLEIITPHSSTTGKLLDPKDVVPTDFLGGDEDGLIPFVEEPIWILI